MFDFFKPTDYLYIKILSINQLMKIFGYDITSKRSADKASNAGAFISAVFSGNRTLQDYSSLNLSAVFRAIDLISDSVATLPIITEYADTQNLFDNIVNMGRYQWLKLTVQSVIKNGNSFTYIRRNSNGVPYELLFLPSTAVNINYDEITDRLYYTVTNKKNIFNVSPQDMLHFRRWTFDGINGRSLLTFAKNAVEIATKTEESANDYFNRDFKGFIKTSAQLSPDKQRELEQNFSFFLQNKQAAVLGQSMDFQQLQQDNANDSQLIEARTYNVKDIARFFGIPQQLLTGESGAYNSLSQAQQEFLIRTVQPYITMLEQELTAKLHEKINLNENEMLRLTTAERAEYINKLLTNGVISINEARAELDLEPIAGGDKHIIAYTKVEDNTINNEETIKQDGENI